MDNDLFCPLTGKRCNGLCAWYDSDDDAQACAVLSIAKSLGRVAFEYDEKGSLLINALNRIADGVWAIS